MQINVFPDYCSTGLWDAESGANIDPESEGITYQPILMALKYWYLTWEFLLTRRGQLSTMAAQDWLKDGEQLVASLNECYAGVHTFVYRADLNEVLAEG